jgi:uncharacterized membrane protein YfcA
MNKFIIAISLVATMFVSNTAFAQYREHRYVHRPRSVAPYVLGGAALGLLGGAIIANEYYRPYCHRVLVEKRWDGYRYVNIYDTVCD